jgi:aminoglycoside phosphotransferase (APT) family kinase protein
VISPGSSAEPADRLADRLPQVLAPVLGAGLSVGRIEPLSGGASRQTWGILVHDGDGSAHELVLRTGRPDLNGGLELEAACLAAAAAAGMPVPAVLCASDDPSVLGCQYLISDRVAGEAIPRRVLRSLRAERTPGNERAGRSAVTGDGGGSAAAGDARGRLLAQCAAALAALHAADPDGVPALPADDPLVLWRDWLDATGQPSAVFEIALRWLLRHRPAPGGTAIVHGDFRMGNLMVDESGLAAVLDWELAHRGDPLEDLGWFCVRAWRFGEDDRPAGGLGSVEEFAASYERAAGTRVDREALRWWRVLGTLRWGVICQRQAQRHLSGQTRSVELAAIGRRACENEWDLLELLAEQGIALAGDPGAGQPGAGQPGSGAPGSGRQPFAGHPVYGRPTLGELVAAVRESLTGAAAGQEPAISGFAARVAANVLAIAERELARDPADQQAYAAVLTRLGAADEAALAAEIRDGRRDHQLAEIAAEFRGIVAARLAVAHPGYASPRLTANRPPAALSRNAVTASRRLLVVPSAVSGVACRVAASRSRSLAAPCQAACGRRTTAWSRSPG